MRAAAIVSFVLALAALPRPAGAFYQEETDSLSAEARGFVRVQNWFNHNPDLAAVYPSSADQGSAGIARLLVDAQAGERLAFELNVYEFASAHTAGEYASAIVSRDVERSSALEWKQRSDSGVDERLAVDRLNARLAYDRLDITVGRQPVSLATCYYFTPNDFFAPFSAQAFYRVYKPGVDAARVEARVGPLTQLTFVGVMGYTPEAGSANGWSGGGNADRASYIARASTSLLNFDWAVLGGQVRGDNVVGGAIQGELLWKVGIRMEGHHTTPDKGDEKTEIAAQLERRFESSLTIRMEGFYHGAGADSVKNYDATGATLYQARWYSAFGLSYEFTHLLYGEALALVNHTDNSYTLAVYTVYSISDEAEVSAGFTAPFGKKTRGFERVSEFGDYPVSFNIEVRSYF